MLAVEKKQRRKGFECWTLAENQQPKQEEVQEIPLEGRVPQFMVDAFSQIDKDLKNNNVSDAL